MYPFAERLADLSMPEPNSGCLLWLGALNESGYGRVKHLRRFLHRVIHVHLFEKFLRKRRLCAA